MAAELIDGRAFAAGVLRRVTAQVSDLAERGIVPGLAVVLVGEDPASQVYVRLKEKQTVESGMLSVAHRLPATTSQAALEDLVGRLNADPRVHGILVQFPLPEGLDEQRIIEGIALAKDVDGFHPENVGRLAAGLPAMAPCTPLGCLMLLRDRLGDMSGLEAVVIGRSHNVGKPMAQLLVAENCTVTLAHSRTRDLPSVVRRADIVVAAAGRPGMVGADWIKSGATVIDIGINRIVSPDGQARLVGDVDFEAASRVAGAITPVPGGVGPMTIACLLANTLTAACRANGLPDPEGLTL